MTSKAMHAKRLVLFLLIAFGLTWIPEIIANKTLGYENWFNTNKYMLVALLILYAPALANLITRALTKEGFRDMLLHLRLKGHIKYYVIAWLFPVVCGFCEVILMNSFVGHWDWAEISANYPLKTYIGMSLNILATAPLMAFNTFGEEFGWRAYMNQHMEPLLGTAGTCIVGGILWGVWHAPLTVEGHNFGKDYWGYPYVGILIMSLLCTFEGMVLMWLTKKTGSVYPAAILHAVNNFGGPAIGQMLMSGIGDQAEFDFGPKYYFLTMIPTVIAGIICLILMLRENKQKAPQKAAAEQL